MVDIISCGRISVRAHHWKAFCYLDIYSLKGSTSGQSRMARAMWFFLSCIGSVLLVWSDVLSAFSLDIDVVKEMSLL